MGQMLFDFTRADQLGLLERCVLPKVAGVSGVAMKAVLKAIDGFGRGREAWPGYDALARSAGVSSRVAKRAVAALESCSLLCVERRGARTLNHYRIVWSELTMLLPENRSERSATTTERSATPTERSATPTLPKCHADTLNVKQPSKETTTTRQQPVVVVSLDVQTAEESETVELLAACHLIDPQRTYHTAVQQMQLEISQIRQRIERWRQLPAVQRSPGVLHNWLTKPRSYQAAVASSTGQHPDVAELRHQRAALADVQRARARSERIANRAASAEQPTLAEIYRKHLQEQQPCSTS